MGHKINPNSYRLGIQRPWQSRWFFRGGYKLILEQDEAIRNAIKKKISAAGVVAIDIERTSSRCRVNIKAAKPGLIIGRGGKGIEELKLVIIRALKKLQKKYSELKLPELSLNIDELKRSEISASYVAQQIAWDMEKRLPFRRTIKKQLDQIMQNKEVKGAKIKVGGRLDGAEIAREEWLAKGSLPLQTLRADIDYAEATAFTSYGTVGIKIWIYKGQVFEAKSKEKK
ncbi:MAG: 30S ribosomal protein S3 [Candidatus Liptonbacteria bacterium]|nr:30S ribosomal protein S3 [Candidatus Liptonbacteria bacterium]